MSWARPRSPARSASGTPSTSAWSKKSSAAQGCSTDDAAKKDAENAAQDADKAAGKTDEKAKKDAEEAVEDVDGN